MRPYATTALQASKPCAYGPASTKTTGTKPKHAALSSTLAKKEEDEWAAAFGGENDEELAPDAGVCVVN
jgi:hypothetical protein